MTLSKIQELVQALSSQDVKKALSICASMDHLNSCDFAGIQAIHYAVIYHSYDLLEYLVNKRKVDVNSTTTLGNTALDILINNMDLTKISAVEIKILSFLFNAKASSTQKIPATLAYLIPTSLQPQANIAVNTAPKPSKNKQTNSQVSTTSPTLSAPLHPAQILLNSSLISSWIKKDWQALYHVLNTLAMGQGFAERKFDTLLAADQQEPFHGFQLLLTRCQHRKDASELLELALFARIDRFNGLFIDDFKERLMEYESILMAVNHDQSKLQAQFHPNWLFAKALELSQQSIELSQELISLHKALTQHHQSLSDSQNTKNPFALFLQSLEISKKAPPPHSKAQQLQNRWLHIKNKIPQDWQEKLAPHMQELLGLIGLTSIKEMLLELIESVAVHHKMTPTHQMLATFNFTLLGNPGTGKTTVARLIGKILYAIGIRKSNHFEEVTARKLMNEDLKALYQLVKKCENGVLFIDEAYALDPAISSTGREIFEELLVIAEEHRSSLSIVLAGYQHEMEQKLFAFNEGLSSRFQNIVLDDFSKAELKLIWQKNIEASKQWSSKGDEVNEVAAYRLSKGSGSKGFGNARAVRNLFEQTVRAALSRLSKEIPWDSKQAIPKEKLVLEMRDILGDPPTRADIPALDQVLKDIEGLIGQSKIKERILSLVSLAERNYMREISGLPPFEITLNRLFLGNPGTGKTTMAKLYGQLLKSLNLLSHGELLSKSASDFVGAYIGESQKKTKALLELAKGKVLLIDEAYVLNDSLYGKQALDTIVEQITGGVGADIAVVMCGYTKEMDEMFRVQNPGLSRRFPRDDAFEFEDFSNSELLVILKKQARESHLSISAPLALRLIDELAKKKAMPHFGNAGEVANRLSRVKEKVALRQSNSPLIVVEEQDLFHESESNRASPIQLLSELSLDESTLEGFKELEALSQLHAKEGGSRPSIGHFQFIGNAGTGKTTVARLMGRFFHQIGVLARDHVEETSGSDLTGDFLGQTKTVVQNKLAAAAGGILFIDEAYQLAQGGQYGMEAITTLIKLMTEPKYDHDKTIIIMAGYETEMLSMMKVNQGLAGRFKNTIHFKDWTVQQCIGLLQKLANQHQLSITVLVSWESIEQKLSRLIQLPQWANARDVISIWDKAKRIRAIRVNQEQIVDRQPIITTTDIERAIDSYLNERSKFLSIADRNQQQGLELPLPQLAMHAKSTIQAKQQAQQLEFKIEENRAEENRTEEYRTEENRTEENRTEENRTEEQEIKALEAQLNTLFDTLKTEKLLSKDYFEKVLNQYFKPEEIENLGDIDISDSRLEEAMLALRNQLASSHPQSDPQEIYQSIKKEVQRLLEKKKEAKRIQERLKEKLKKRIPILVCGYCQRPWGKGRGQCTYMGPKIAGYQEVAVEEAEK